MFLWLVAKITLCIGAGFFVASCVVADFSPDHPLVMAYTRGALVAFAVGLGMAALYAVAGRALYRSPNRRMA